MQRRVVSGSLRLATLQLLAAKPTRAALVWSVTRPLTPYPEITRELAHGNGPTVRLNGGLNGSAPAGSLGDACIAFRLANGLKSINAGNQATADPAQTLGVRRLLWHDALHVLLDFEPNWPGQMGVFSFVAAQQYCPQFEWAARLLGQTYMTAAPWMRDEFADAEYRGRQLALAAPRLLATPLEHEWHTSLTELRARLNLRSVRTLPSIDWDASTSAIAR